MSEIFEQLELNHTFFIQFAIFAVVFFILSKVYFAPFLKLFEARANRTTKDREAAEKLMAEAQTKLEDYRRRLAEERTTAKNEYESILNEGKKEEAALLSRAREEAKKITQEAVEAVSGQRDRLRQQLESDVEGLAKAISEKLLSRKM